MAGAAFFPSRHAEDVILVLLAAPAAHGRREPIVPLEHFSLPLCVQIFLMQPCTGRASRPS